MNTRIAFSLVAVFAAGLAVSCDSRASLTRSRIKAVEKGLVRARFLKGAKPEAFGLRERMAFYQVPAVSIAVVDGFRLEWARAYGMKAAGSSDPATPETLFQAGALGQAPAAAAALRLVEQGRLDLEADVNASLRGWRVPRTGSPGRGPVTLAALLSHSAGFEPVDLAGIPQGSAGPNLDQVLSGTPPAKNAPLRPSAEPGSRDLFSEAGFAALEKLLIDVGGRPFPALMKETVLDPAGMSESTYESPLSEAWRVRAAAGHRGDGRPVEGGWFDYPARAAKGLWATPTDLAVFGAAVMEAAAGKPSSLLGPAAARAMLTPRVAVRSLGFVVEGETRERLLVSLQGRTDGFASMLVMVPDKRQAAVVMANGDNGEPLIDEILRALSAAYGWAYFKPEEKLLYRLDPSVSGSYVGRYRLGSGAVLEVSAEDPFLVLTSAGRPPIKLYVDGETVFFSIDPPLRVRFQKDGSGRVDRLVLIQGRSLQEAVRSE